jgi:uncharacterized glyoxalase superfamily protein PhnB
MAGAAPRGLGWRSLTPTLPVRDVKASLAWYRDALGCEIAWVWDDGRFAAVFHGDVVEIFFAPAAGPVTPITCYVRVDDADRLHALYRERGVAIAEPLESKPWGAREFAVRDPDGHVFRLGHGEKSVAEISRFTQPG